MDGAMAMAVAVIAAALVFDFLNGFHDSANAIATIVVTKKPSAPKTQPSIQPKLPGVVKLIIILATAPGCSRSNNSCEIDGFSLNTRMNVRRKVASGRTHKNGADAISVVT